MNRLFFRFFVLVMIAISVATFVVYFAVNRLFGDPLEDIARRQAAAQIFLLQQYVDKAGADEWLARLNRVREVSASANFDLIPLTEARAALPPDQHSLLARGEIVVDVKAKAFYRRVDIQGQAYVGAEDDVIRASGLPIDVGLALQMEVVRFVIVALALLLPIALWSRSHWQGLQSLSRVADAVGEGRLAVRAELPKSASIYPLGQHINRMAERIEGLLAAQKNLLHSVSHELRTPIARLEFALELLREAPNASRIEGMEGDIQELKALVNELLVSAQQSAQRQPFDLALALRTTVAGLDHEPGAERMFVALAPNLGELDADQRLLMRAVANLLKNALRYADQRISLEARSLGDGVEIAIEDDGPGIPAAERARVFEPFYRLDRSRDRATGGFGLGLAIVRQAVELHGGSVRVESAHLGGARFVITVGRG